ncbi:MAG: hypothetical protein QW052_06260 [Candidatus Nitrosocaldaceae archaeon]
MFAYYYQKDLLSELEKYMKDIDIYLKIESIDNMITDERIGCECISRIRVITKDKLSEYELNNLNEVMKNMGYRFEGMEEG